MRIVPEIRWRADAGARGALDDRLLPLLAAIAAGGSLVAAARSLGLSYRALWGLLERARESLGAPLATLARGRGAELAPAGVALLAAQMRAERRTADLRAALAIDLAEVHPPCPVVPRAARRNARAGRPRARRNLAQPLLRLSASHDLALAALRDVLAVERTLAIELVAKGSVEAVQDFALGRADAAGFHVPLTRPARHWQPFARWLSASRDRLVRFADREQGLILASGNPARVRSVRDIARRGLRFVNRQTGSGTRLLVDELLARNQLAPGAIRGYRREELTHSAVAEAVAAGRADAGFGIRAVAVQRGLAFLPLVRERYYLAVRAAAVGGPAVTRLTSALQGASFARIIAGLPGYDGDRAGAIEVLPAALNDER